MERSTAEAPVAERVQRQVTPIKENPAIDSQRTSLPELLSKKKSAARYASAPAKVPELEDEDEQSPRPDEAPVCSPAQASTSDRGTAPQQRSMEAVRKSTSLPLTRLDAGVNAEGLLPNDQNSVGQESDGGGAKGSKCEASMLFAECFKDDLFQQRRLLMSQVNNLYRMRKNGQTMAYKDAGYDKLHDFIMDIPGLGLHGCGNQMEVSVVDMARFEELCSTSANVLNESSFEKPAPVPESFQNQVIETFRRLSVREIPTKNFTDIFNQFFPEEKLHSKNFGYRDVRGLIANVSVVDRIGGKIQARYVLKPEISLERAEGPSQPPMVMERWQDEYRGFPRGAAPICPMDFPASPKKACNWQGKLSNE